MEQAIRLNDFDFLGMYWIRIRNMSFALCVYALLDSSGLNFFISHLMGLLATHKPDNANEYCEKYFTKVASCQHVIGSDYNFISGCKHNRRAFIFCLHEVLVSFALTDEFCVPEFQQIIEQLCPDFPYLLAEDASRLINPHNVSSRPPKYVLKDLLLAFSFQFLYSEWLRELDKAYSTEMRDVTRGISTVKMKHLIENINRNFPLSLDQPPASVLEPAVASLHHHEVTREEVRRAVFENSAMALSLTKIRFMAPSLSTVMLAVEEAVAGAVAELTTSESL
jgi:hypothetical protein